MARPASQLENQRPSGLKQPSRLPALAVSASVNASRSLLETSQSDLNARTAVPVAGGGGLMGPPVSTIKHRMMGQPQPEPPNKQRKTLAERAGEPLQPTRSGIPPPVSYGSSKPSLARTESNTAQVGTLRQAYTNGHRNASTASSVSSYSNGSRTPSRQVQQRNNARFPSNASSQRQPIFAPPAVADDETEDDYDDPSEVGVMGKRKAWDTVGRLADMKGMWLEMQRQVASAAEVKDGLDERLAEHKARVQELAQLNRDLTSDTRTLNTDLERARADLHTTTTDLRQTRRDQERDLEDADRKHRNALHELELAHDKVLQRLERERERDTDRLTRELETQQRESEQAMRVAINAAEQKLWEEISEVKKKYESEKAELQSTIDELRKASENRASESAGEVQSLRDAVANLNNQIDAAAATTTSLRARIAAEGERNNVLEQTNAQLVSKTHFLEGNQEAQSHEFTTMRQALQDAITAKEGTLVTLRKEEMLRRKLNATVLELRGNIRVFTRIRPLLGAELDEGAAKVEYPDAPADGEELLEGEGGKELVVHAPTSLSATGKERNEKHAYAFDRVFGPLSTNREVFTECQDLIQSVVDGYNVSILSYGQTGSGKTYGMSGPEGIIPSAIGILLRELERLRGKGWEYEVEARFVEVYNEMLNDLLGDAKTWDAQEEREMKGSTTNGTAKARREKHEIRHDPLTGKTTVAGLASVSLWPPPPAACDEIVPATSDSSTHTAAAVTSLLALADKNRRVAATQSNARSSRSHSVFMLTLRGTCAATNEASEGVLNLVDLAGSERLKASGAEGDRKKETMAINKSLSSLGDVIAALGSAPKGEGAGGHVPYRNSKLTYLLQNSLGGVGPNGKSSRTLMLLHLSPLAAHWAESRGSLVFGSKVHGTHIGRAKK